MLVFCGHENTLWTWENILSYVYQQDNLDALVNIGKSVICRDPFVPTQHYLRLVVENICTQRNILSLLELPIIDFIKIHKVLLSIHNGRSNDGILLKAYMTLNYNMELIWLDMD